MGSEVEVVSSGDRVAHPGILGSYAEYAVIPTDRLVRIPDKIARATGGCPHAARHDRALSLSKRIAIWRGEKPPESYC